MPRGFGVVVVVARHSRPVASRGAKASVSGAAPLARNDSRAILTLSPGSGFREPRSQLDGLTADAEPEMPAALSAEKDAARRQAIPNL